MKNEYRLNLSKHSTHQIVLGNIGKGKTVLDVGCNDGYIGKCAHKSNVFYGIDYSPESVKKAKRVYRDAAPYDLNNLHPLPWNRRFDVIVFADVLEHLMFPEKVLAYFVRNYLKKNGEVIISLPNVANFTIRLQLLTGKFNYTNSGILDRTHFHLYTDRSARELISSAGLEVINRKGGSIHFGYIINNMGIFKDLLSFNLIYKAKIAK